MIKTIRDMCVFAKHDLLKDPPFSRVDLISCQNVLIYLDNGAQGRILKSFHYALKPAGYLGARPIGEPPRWPGTSSTNRSAVQGVHQKVHLR